LYLITEYFRKSLDKSKCIFKIVIFDLNERIYLWLSVFEFSSEVCAAVGSLPWIFCILYQEQKCFLYWYLFFIIQNLVFFISKMLIYFLYQKMPKYVIKLRTFTSLYIYIHILSFPWNESSFRHQKFIPVILKCYTCYLRC